MSLTMAKSPFPGMDPFLERHWSGVHNKLIVYATDQIQEQLPDELRAGTNERVFVESIDEHREIYPDLFVVESPPRDLPFRSAAGTGGLLVAEPAILHRADEPVRQPYVEIIDVVGGRVVTVVKFVSPSNKLHGTGRRLYEQKQQECQDAGVNLVEIDLTRRGRRKFLCPQESLDKVRPGEYQSCVWRSSFPDRFELYGFPLRERLPALRVPLREEDDDVLLDLQSLIDRVYVMGRYPIDYREPLDPPLTVEHREWLETRLAERESSLENKQ